MRTERERDTSQDTSTDPWDGDRCVWSCPSLPLPFFLVLSWFFTLGAVVGKGGSTVSESRDVGSGVEGSTGELRPCGVGEDTPLWSFF